MKKIDIKGKEYVQVHERVMEFHKLYPNGSIVTEIIEMTERCITRTKVTPDVSNPDRYFTGIAYEQEGSNYINKTSFIEQCETSSCGRALGFLNIGIKKAIASAEEISNAIEQQKTSDPRMDLDEANHKLADEVAEKLGGTVVTDSVEFPSGSNIIKFGKHKGKSWSDVPIDYVEWCMTKSSADFVKEQAQAEYNKRNKNKGVPVKVEKVGVDEEIPF